MKWTRNETNIKYLIDNGSGVQVISPSTVISKRRFFDSPKTSISLQCLYQIGEIQILHYVSIYMTSANSQTN